jgi:hypothetical protein
MTGVENQELGYRSLACAGDVNGDGYDDFLYTQGHYISGSYPKVYVLYGGAIFDSVPDVILYYTEWPPFIGFFGRSIGCIGDVNQDGYSDVMVSRNDDIHPLMSSGCVYIYYGGENMDGVPDNMINDPSPPDANYQFGYDLCTVDFWRDGNPPDVYPDIVIGCPKGDGPGKVYVYFGPTYNQYTMLDNALPPQYNNVDRFGHAVTAGDYNNDDCDEIVIGAPEYDEWKGAIAAYWAYEGWPMPTPYLLWPLQYSFGFDLASGDVTNDDTCDLFISLPGAEGEHGQVKVSYGTRYWAGYDIELNQTLYGTWPHDNFGTSIAHCGDINGDQYR